MRFAADAAQRVHELAEPIGPRRVFLGDIPLVLLGRIAHSLPLLIARALIGAGTSPASPVASLCGRPDECGRT